MMNCLIIVYDYESCDCNQDVYLDKTLTGKNAFSNTEIIKVVEMISKQTYLEHVVYILCETSIGVELNPNKLAYCSIHHSDLNSYL